MSVIRGRIRIIARMRSIGVLIFCKFDISIVFLSPQVDKDCPHVHPLQCISHYQQASKFSAYGLNSPPGRSILVILEISVNPLRKKKIPPWGGGSKSHVNSLGNDYYLHMLRKVLLITKNATASRGSAPWSPIKGSPLDPDGLLRRPPNPWPHRRSMVRPRFSAPKDFVHLEA